jgi:hypothetical protein
MAAAEYAANEDADRPVVMWATTAPQRDAQLAARKESYQRLLGN